MNGTTVRQIMSGGGAAVNGGSITIGAIDGEIDTAELEIGSSGTTTSGDVMLGSVTPATSYKGLNRLSIVTGGPRRDKFP